MPESLEFGAILEITRHPADLKPELRGSVAALGNFDGFHRGHQVVVGEAGRLAREMNVPLTVVTTEPHPRQFFAREDAAFRLTPFRDRAVLFEKFGVDSLVCLPFDQALSQTLAQDFVLKDLIDGLGLLHIVVGYDYRFGKKRGGGIDVLRWMGDLEGFGVSVVKPVTFGIEGAAGQVYSSSLVRDTLRQGQARHAASLLGHWWTVSGRVLEGDKRGRTIGFPTINLKLDDILCPKFGVYAVRVQIDGEAPVYDGVANIGVRPTFDQRGVLLEAHLFHFDDLVYDRHARVELVGFIRPERRFDGIEALKAQIERDCETAQTMLSDPENIRERLMPPSLNDYLETHASPLAMIL